MALFSYKEILTHHKTPLSQLSALVGQKSILCHHNIKKVKEKIKIWEYKICRERVSHTSQFSSVTAKKIIRKSKAQFWKKLRKLRLKQNDGFLIMKHVLDVTYEALSVKSN